MTARLFSLLFFLCLLLGSTAPAQAQGSRKDDIVLNARGQPIVGALIRVCTATAAGQPCAPLAQIYSDQALSAPLLNPTTTDGLGNYFFYAAPGRYLIEISGSGIVTRQFPNVIVPSDPSNPSFTSVTSTSGMTADSLIINSNLTVNGTASVAGNLSLGSFTTWTDIATPGPNPAAGKHLVYVKSGGNVLCTKNPAGVETCGAGGGGAVNSVFGRSGDVTAQAGDYSFSLLSGNIAVSQMSSGTGASASTFWRGDGTWSAAPVTSVFGRTGGVTAQSGDYSFPQISGTATNAQLPGTFSNKVLDNTNSFSGFFDAVRISVPANPAAGNLRIFADNATGKVACRDSAGVDCMPASGGGGSSFTDAAFDVHDDAVASKIFRFDLGTVTASTTTTLRPKSTVNRTIELPDTSDTLAPAAPTYLLVSANSLLPNSRVFACGSGLTCVDGGAGGNLSVSLAGTVVDTTSAQIISGLKTIDRGTIPDIGLFFDIAQPTAAGTRTSHFLDMRGASFDTAGHNADWRHFVRPLTNAGASERVWQSRVDAGAFTDRAALRDDFVWRWTGVSTPSGNPSGSDYFVYVKSSSHQLCTKNSSGTETCGGAGGGGGYATVQDEGISLTQRATLNFAGAGVSCTDNAGSSRTDCTISGGGGLGDPGSNGIVARTALNVTTARTITGTAGNITVANGDGVSGNPTIDLASTAVQTDQANTWTTGAQDMGSATSLIVPKAAGAAPTAQGDIRYDTTQDITKLGGRGSITGSVPRTLSAQFSSTDSIDAGAGTSETAFATSFQLPANFFRANKVVRITVVFDHTTTGSPPELTVRARLQKSGPTNVNFYAPASAVTPATSIANRGFGAEFILQGTGAPSATASVEAGLARFGYSNLGAIADFHNQIAQPITLDTTAAQTIQITAQWGTATAGNVVKLRQLIVEELN